MDRHVCRPLCLIAAVVVCALVVAVTSAPGLAGQNPNVKAAIHVKAHPTSCTKGYPTFTKCGDILTTWGGALNTDTDVLPVFYDLVGYSVTEFGLKWPAAWGTMSWVRCKGELAVGGISSPGEGTAIAWTSCQSTWSIAPGYGWLYPTSAGKVEIRRNPATGDSGVVDCSPTPGPYYDYCVATYDGGIGGVAGDDPCVAPIVPLTLTKTDNIGGTSCVFPGGGVTYTLAYTNPNSGAVNNVVITDFLPVNVDYVTSTGGGVYDGPNHKVVWSIGTVAGSGAGSVTVDVTVKSATAPGAGLVNNCEIVSDQTPVPKTAQLTTRVCACSIDGPGTVCPGSKIQFCAPVGMTSYAWSVTGNGTVFGVANQRCVTMWAGNTCAQSYTVHLTLVDQYEIQSQCDKVVMVNDTEAPVITGCPANTAVECLSQVPTPNIAAVTYADNCSNVTVTHMGDVQSGTCVGTEVITIERTYRATDQCGNFDECVQVITVDDTTPPTITGFPPGDSVGCLSEVPAADTLLVTATDNCGTATVAWQQDQLTGQECSGTLWRTYRVSDECGNYVDSIQTVFILDSTDPVITGFPADDDLQCLSDLPAADTLLVTATDNCGAARISWEGDITTGTDCNGMVERTYRATDDCGNYVDRVQTFTILDTTDPVFTGFPADDDLQCLSDLPAHDTGLVTATDNCGAARISWEGDITTGTDCNGMVERTYRATDDCGHYVDQVQTFTILDTTDPVFTGFPADDNLQCVTDLPAHDTGLVTATDNCGMATISWEGDIATGSDCNGTVERTYRATDDCGNYVDQVQTFTILDTTEPQFTGQCPADVAAECDDVPAAPTMTASDNCDNDVYVSFDEQRINGACAHGYTLVRTWTATDDCGNDVECVQTITVTDTEEPVLTCAADERVPCGGPITFTDPTVSDNCDAAATLNDLGETSTPGPGSGEVTHTKCWTATDDCGNTSNQCCQSIIEEACEYLRLTLAKTDNSADCFYAGDSITYTIDYGNPNTLEVTSVVLTDGIPAGTNYVSSTGGGAWNPGNGTVTWSLGTLAGSAGGSVDVVVAVEAAVAPGTMLGNDCEIACTETSPTTYHLDTPVCACLISGPTTVCPHKAYEFCGPEGMTSYDWTITGDGTITTPRNVRCIQVEAGPGPGLAGEQGVPACEYDYILELTVGEPLGGTSFCDLSVQGRDGVGPEITCPRDTTFECSGIGDAGTATATDNCDDSPQVDYVDNIVAGPGPGCYVIERTWTAADDCGNSAQCVQNIVIVDTTPPEITCAPDEIIVCGDLLVFTEPAATDLCDGAPEVTEISTEITWVPIANELRYTRCWEASDHCGNTTDRCCQTITRQGCTFVPLRITKDDGLTLPAAPGETVNYEITVYNDNQVEVTSVSVVDQLPARANFVSASGVYNYDTSDHDVMWVVPSIPGSGSVVLSLAVEVDAQVVSEDLINIASASCPQVIGSVEAAETTRVESDRLEVPVDIKPGLCPNTLNPRGTGQVSVAVLGTDQLDVTDIDASSILLGREGVAGTVAPTSSSVADVATPFTGELCGCTTDGADGHPDLVLKFSNVDLFTTLALNSVKSRYVELILSGQLLDDTEIVGSDCARILGKAENPGIGILMATKETSFLAGAQICMAGSDIGLAFALADPGHVRIDVFDVQGRLVTRLVDTEMSEGEHSVSWDTTDQFGKRVPVGIYFARLSTAEMHVTKKLVVIE